MSDLTIITKKFSSLLDADLNDPNVKEIVRGMSRATIEATKGNFKDCEKIMNETIEYLHDTESSGLMRKYDPVLQSMKEEYQELPSATKTTTPITTKHSTTKKEATSMSKTKKTDTYESRIEKILLEDEDGEVFSYISCQDIPVGEKPIDEVQQIMLAYMRGHPIILQGEPGVGKTQALKFVANNIIGKEIYRHNCAPDEMSADLLGSVSLEAEESKDGKSIATKTSFKPGDITKGMMDNCIVYLDEFNQLKPSVQKSLNAPLEQEPSLRIDGENVEVGEDYMIVLSNNPTKSGIAKDIEASVLSRVKAIPFKDLPEDLLARISLLQSGLIDDPKLILDDEFEIRGVVKKGARNYEFVKQTVEGDWVGFFDESKNYESKEVMPYLFYNKTSGDNYLDTDSKRVEQLYKLSRKLVSFKEDIKNVIKKGTAYFSDEFLENLNLNRTKNLPFDAPSPRPIKYAIEDYDSLIDLGADEGYALEVATKSFINNISSDPKVGEKVLGRNGMNFRDLITAMAKVKRLISDENFEYKSLDEYTKEE